MLARTQRAQSPYKCMTYKYIQMKPAGYGYSCMGTNCQSFDWYKYRSTTVRTVLSVQDTVRPEIDDRLAVGQTAVRFPNDCSNGSTVTRYTLPFVRPSSSGRISKAYPLFQAETYPAMYRSAPADE